MNDEALRGLLRRWQETGSVDDHAAWLFAGLRVGQVDRERLVVASALDHGAARRALGGDAGESIDPISFACGRRLFAYGADLPATVGLLTRSKELVTARVALARALTTGLVSGRLALLEPSLSAAEAWVACP